MSSGITSPCGGKGADAILSSIAIIMFSFKSRLWF
jgi:hypothetical protein